MQEETKNNEEDEDDNDDEGSNTNKNNETNYDGVWNMDDTAFDDDEDDTKGDNNNEDISRSSATTKTYTGPLGEIKQKIEQVLQSVNMSEKRASKLDIDDFLYLLTAMNKAGIHFHA